MIIYFITTQPEICQILQHNLKEHTCFIFSELSPVIDLIEKKGARPDLIAADYMITNHSVFNIYDQMDKYNLHIPLIFYNDPIVITRNRPIHWKTLIKMSDPCNKELDLEKYSPVFETIARLIESPELNPYIYMMQQPKPLPKHMLINYLYNDFQIASLESRLYAARKFKKMTDGLFFLLELLYKLQDKPSTLEAIQQEYKLNRKHIKLESLKVELSRLKSILKNNPDSRFTIIKRLEGFQLVEF